MCKTKPICHDQLCKTNPISPVGRGPEGRNVQNEANSGGSLKFEVSSVKTGKVVVGASNFTLYTSNSAEGRSCETKPISGGAGRDGASGTGA
jgi:hypothetical protein